VVVVIGNAPLDTQGKLGKDAGSVVCLAHVLADRSIASDRRSV